MIFYTLFVHSKRKSTPHNLWVINLLSIFMWFLIDFVLNRITLSFFYHFNCNFETVLNWPKRWLCCHCCCCTWWPNLTHSTLWRHALMCVCVCCIYVCIYGRLYVQRCVVAIFTANVFWFCIRFLSLITKTMQQATNSQSIKGCVFVIVVFNFWFCVIVFRFLLLWPRVQDLFFCCFLFIYFFFFENTFMINFFMTLWFSLSILLHTHTRTYNGKINFISFDALHTGDFGFELIHLFGLSWFHFITLILMFLCSCVFL